MSRSCRGFSLVDLVVILALLVVMVCLLFPALGTSRDASRRSGCINNLKQLGLALHNFHDAHNRFPGSNDVPLLEKPDASWKKVPLHTPAKPAPDIDRAQHGTNFSWMARITPYMEETSVHKWLDMVNRRAWDPCEDNPIDPETEQPASLALPCHPIAWRATIDSFRCPDARTDDFCKANPQAGIDKNPYDPKTVYGPAGLTNYVALGATHSDSLMGVEKNQFAGGKRHPNGTLFPGGKIGIDDMTDGSSNTFMVCETIEPTLAAWYEGSTAAVFGLAGKPKFEQTDVVGSNYGVPAEGTKTTLNRGNAAANPKEFYLAAGQQGIPWLHGPSSHHWGGIVNHLLGDGSARGVKDKIDPKLYMHLITRSGREPVNAFFEENKPTWFERLFR